MRLNVFSCVSVVLPAIDETYSLRESVEIILQTCNHKDVCEIFVVVCERTTPECLVVINGLCESVTDIPIRLYHQKMSGLGSALYEAMQRVKGSHVVNIAADMDTDPHVIKEMIAIAKEHPEAVILASRWVKGGGFSGYGRIHKMLNFSFNKMLQILFFTGVKDLTYGYRFAPVDKTLSVKWESKGFSIGMETNLKMLRLGYNIIEIPAIWRVREQGESQNSFFTKLKYIKTVLKVRFARLATIKNPDYAEKAN